MPRIANLIQLFHKLVKLILLQTNAHIKNMVWRSIFGVYDPATRDLFPRMLDLEIVPALAEWSGNDADCR